MKLHNWCSYMLITLKFAHDSTKKSNRAEFLDCMFAFCIIQHQVHAATGPLALLAAGCGPAHCQGEQKIGKHLDSGMTLKFVWLQWPVLSSGSGWKYKRVWPSACFSTAYRTRVLLAIWGKRPSGPGFARIHMHTQWCATDIVQPLAISVISPVDMNAACDTEKTSLSDVRLVSDLTGEYMVDVSLKSLRSVLRNTF